MTLIDLLLQSILTAYFSSSRCLILLTEEQCCFGIVPALPIVAIHLNESRYLQNIFNYLGCQDFILNVQHPASIFQDIEHEIRLHPDRFNKRKYVFLPHDDQKEDPFDIRQSDGIEHVSDLLIICKEADQQPTNTSNTFLSSDRSDEVYTVWTHKYTGQTDNNAFYVLDKWFSRNQSFLFNNLLLPDKLIDQAGRCLKAAVFQYEPYVILEPKGNGTYSYMGSEMVTLLKFAEHHNMTLMPIINEFDYWGEVWENWSGNGLMGNLIEDRADIGATALYTWESAYKFLDLSKPTVRTGITCLVPAPKLAASWMTPLRVYSSEIWMTVIGTFVAITIMLYLLGVLQFSTNTNPSQNTKLMKVKLFETVIISVSKPFIRQTGKEVVEGLLGRYLMGLVFITALIISTTYDSGLATIMTIPRYDDPIDTVDDLVESGLHWGATQDGWIMSIQKAQELNLIKLVQRFVPTSEENLRRFSLSGHFAYSVERLPNGNYAVGNYLSREVINNFHLMTEDIYWEQSVMMARKNSILLPHVDMFILRVFEAGLISFWQNEATTEYMDQYVQKVVKYLAHHQIQHGIVKLKIMHVQGVFGILVFGNGTAFAVFLIELFYDRFCSRVEYYL